MGQDEKSTTKSLAGQTSTVVEVSGSDIADKDIALSLVGERAQLYDPSVEVRVLRKCGLFFLPALALRKDIKANQSNPQMCATDCF